MKILLASSAGIYDKFYKDTQIEQTGFGIMIRALADMLPLEGDEVDIITQSNFTRGHKIGGSTLLKRTWLQMFLHIKPFYLKRAAHICRYEKMGFKMKLKTLLAFMTGSYCEYILRKKKHDVVHINGIGTTSTAYMYACTRTGTPFVLTLHGLISFSDTVKALTYAKNMEREFFKLNKDNPKALSTVIGTGIKNRLCNLVDKQMDTINVVCNPVISASAGEVCVSKPNNQKIIVCVGNVSINKNQKTVVEAFCEMCRDNAIDAKLYIIGGREADLKAYTEQQGIKNVIFTGTLERREVYAYYSIADLCIMASVDEGFGLSLVEGYSFGVPCVMPSAIDAFPDLYNEECCVPAYDYKVSTFANAMYSALNREWDKDKIKAYAQKFSEANCANGYLRVLRQAAEFKATPFDIAALDNLVDKCLGL